MTDNKDKEIELLTSINKKIGELNGKINGIVWVFVIVKVWQWLVWVSTQPI